jgi:CRP-like cAMP-binding protein
LSDDGRQNADVCDYAPGESIFLVGDPGDYLAVLLNGAVEIRKDKHVISLVDAGCIFGEMGLIDKQPRMADAISKSHSRVAKIREGQFMSLLEGSPYFSLAVMRFLTERLRHRVDT